MTLLRMIDGVVSLDSEGLAPSSFSELVAGLKLATNRAALQAFVAVVGSWEEEAEKVDRGGEIHRFKQVSEKEWLTPFGLARVRRRYYQPDAGGEGVVPLDERCGMVGRYLTPDLEEATAYASALLVPREVETLLGKVLPQGPSSTAIQRVMRNAGGFAEEHEERVEAAMIRDAALSPDGDVCVVSWDGVTVPLREPGTKRGRGPDRPGRPTDRATPTAWKEAGVGTVSIYERRAGPDGIEPVLVDKRQFGRMPECGMKTLMRQQSTVVTGWRAGARHTEVVVLCDGKDNIWSAAKKVKAYAQATWILDYYHAVGQLAKAGEAIFGKRAAEGQRWFDRYKGRLKDEKDGAGKTLRSLRYYYKRLQPGTRRHECVRKVIDYFKTHRAKMDYAGFRARGLPIGSGPVEATCKNLVAARLKRSGMRWSRSGGQQILNLRSHVLSNRWDVFWNVYCEKRAA